MFIWMVDENLCKDVIDGRNQLDLEEIYVGVSFCYLEQRYNRAMTAWVL